MMKKCFLLMMISLIFCCLTIPALAEVKAPQVYASDSPLLYTVKSDGVWLYTQDRLLWYGDGDREPQAIIQRKNIVSLASRVGSTELYYLTEAADGSQSLHAITAGGTVALDAVSLPDGKRIAELAMSDGLWGLTEDSSVCAIYTGNGSMTTLSIAGWDNSGVTTFAAYQNQLLAYKAQSGELALLDPFTHTVIASVNVPALRDVQIGRLKKGTPTALALLETDAGHELIMIRMDGGEAEVLDANLPADCKGLLRNEQTLYTLGNHETTLFSLSLRELYGETGKSTLTIVNHRSTWNRMKIATDLFHEKYPNVEIVEREMDDGAVIATEMMAGSDGIDLVGIQDAYMPISVGTLLRTGAILDLNQFEELVSLKENYRDIFGMVSISGHWFATPDIPRAHFWRVDINLAKALGWEPPEGRWSWQEFMELAERVKEYNETAEKPMYLLRDDNNLYPYFFHEYQANHVNAYEGVADYTSGAYIHLLEMWKYLNDNHLIDPTPKTSSSTTLNVLLYADKIARLGMGSSTYVLPPTESEESLYPIYGIGTLCLNANTRHLEEAVYFLSCYMSVEAVSYAYANGGQWLIDVEGADDAHVGVSDRNAALWNDMIEHGTPELYLYDISRQQSNTLLPGLLDGSVTPEQFAQISQQLADMMLGE